MSVVSIAILGITAVVLSIQFKTIRPEYSILITIGVGILISFYALSKMETILRVMEEIQGYIKISPIYVSTLLKIIGITYIAEFSAGICKDAGYGAIANQIEIFSKLTILAVSMPVVLALLETLNSLLS